MIHLLVASGALLSLLALFSAFEVVSSKTAHAQTAVPVIRSLDPKPPHCVLRKSNKAGDRLLTITGEDLLLYEEKAVQFLDVTTGRESALFYQEVDWRDPRCTMIDMTLVEQQLRLGAQVRLRSGLFRKSHRVYLQSRQAIFFWLTTYPVAGLQAPFRLHHRFENLPVTYGQMWSSERRTSLKQAKVRLCHTRSSILAES